VLTGEVKDSLLLDAIPWTVGIAIGEGVFFRLVERNTNLPTKHSEVFTTTEDFQESAQIRVYQGEHEQAAANICLGAFTVAGLPSISKGGPQLEVTIDIDANCTVRVSARDLSSGSERSMVVDAESARHIEEPDLHARITAAG
jgi:molecular chaperone DnaK